MTYGNPAESVTAAELVNSLREDELADLLFTYGEERFSRGIAREIVASRKKRKLETTNDLVACVLKGTPEWYHHRKIHPATKTFQALRIATNDELGALREALNETMARLSECGRIAVITFHSIEDRVVKSAFKDAAYTGAGTVLTRKPVVAGVAELHENPRARSAKLRIFEKCKQRTPTSFITQPVQEYA